MVHHSVFYEQRLSQLFDTKKSVFIQKIDTLFLLFFFTSTYQDIKKPTEGSILSLYQSYYDRNY
jgi:hypothetical protein